MVLYRKKVRIVRWIESILFALCFLLSFSIYVSAEKSPEVVCSRIADKDLLIYVSGVDVIGQELNIQIGNTVIESDLISCQRMVNTEFPIHTVLLLDNSYSLNKLWGETAKKLMTELIDAHVPNEQFEIVTYTEEYSILSDFSDDYEELKSVIDNISFVYKASYFSDTLYELISSLRESGEPCFMRIVVICDGADDEEITYTNFELNELVSESGIPVHAIGVHDTNNSNALELLASFSKASGGRFLEVTKESDTKEAKVLVEEDYYMSCIRVGLPLALKDGSVKEAVLTIGSGDQEQVLVTNLTMPFDVPKECEVVFADETGTTIYSSITVKENEIPSYQGEIPVKEDDDNYTYRFEGWTDGTAIYVPGDVFPPVSDNMTYTAVFSSGKKAESVPENINVNEQEPIVAEENNHLLAWIIGVIVLLVILIAFYILFQHKFRNRVDVSLDDSDSDDQMKQQADGCSGETQLLNNDDLTQITVNQADSCSGETQLLNNDDLTQITEQQSDSCSGESRLLNDDEDLTQITELEKNAVKLILENYDHPENCYFCFFSESAIIGRNSDNDISILNDSTVSGRHCMIERRGTAFFLSDLKSSNHTFYYGKQNPNDPNNRNEISSEITILNGDVIEVGQGRYVVRIEDPDCTLCQ